jgi:hypothetical protein
VEYREAIASDIVALRLAHPTDYSIQRLLDVVPRRHLPYAPRNIDDLVAIVTRRRSGKKKLRRLSANESTRVAARRPAYRVINTSGRSDFRRCASALRDLPGFTRPAKTESLLSRSIAAALFTGAPLPQSAGAWGDEGHELIALITEQNLEPATRAEVGAMLSTDPDSLTAHDIASEATWADWYRDSDSDGSRERYKRTREWHFVNIELGSPNLDRACRRHPPLPPGAPASRGRRRPASSTRSTNSRPNWPTPRPIPRSG